MTRVYRAVAIVSPPIAALTVVVAGALTPGYDPVARTISRLATPGMPFAQPVDAAICLVACSCLATAAALERGALAGRLALVLAGCAFVATAIIHLDPTSTQATLLHRIASGVAVAGLTVGQLVLARTYGRISLLVGLAEVAMLAIALVLLALPFEAWGSWERALLALALAWIVFTAATMPSTDEIASASAASLSSSGS